MPAGAGRILRGAGISVLLQRPRFLHVLVAEEVRVLHVLQ